MSTFLPRKARQAFCAMLLLLESDAAFAADLQVAPTTVVLAAERNADGLMLRNSGDAPLHAQIRVFRWTQAGGEDQLVATSDLAVSPPMLELPPDREQLVRIVRLGPPPADTEASYRVVVDELPLEREPDAAQRGLRFVLRYSIPVFLAPLLAPAPTPPLQVRVTSEADARYLELGNPGSRHVQVADLVHAGTDGSRREIAAGLSGYVLPGQRRRWRLPAGLPDAGTFEARINGEADARALAPDR